MKTIKNILLFSAFFTSVSVFGTHWAGADLAYRSLGGNAYEITLSLYRDCIGAQAPASVNITFTCTSNPAFTFHATMLRLPYTGQEITPACSAIPTRCSDSSGSYGVQEYIYRTNVTLAPCNFYRISYQLCCRNTNNTTQNPTSKNGYIEATINTLQANGSSSPIFTNKVVTIICQGYTNCYNHGAIDLDGDSLSYELTSPLHNATTPLTYFSGYSYQQPLQSIPNVTCNAVTGDICMTPQTNIVTVMAVLIKKWRTIDSIPVVVGSTMRDIQINVVQCINNTPPVLSGMDTTLTKGYDPSDTIYYKDICLGTYVNFNIYGYDADINNPAVLGNPERFSISWNNGIPGGTFTTYHNGTDSAYANFVWHTTSNLASNTPYCFTATIQDEACPYNGINSYSYCLTVRGMWVDIGRDTLICRGETLTVTAMADTTTVNYLWKVNGVLTGTPQTSNVFVFNSADYPAGVHQISVENNDGGVTTHCPGLSSIRVNVVHIPNVNLGNDTLICEGNSLTLDAGPAQIYAWSTGAHTQTITISHPTSALYWVWVDGGNSTRCTNSDSIYVETVPMPNFNIGQDTCLNEAITIGPDGLNPMFNWYYEWNTGSVDSALNITQSGVYTLTVINKPGSGCYRSDSRLINIIDTSKWKAENSGIDICTHQSHELVGPKAPAGHSYVYIWQMNGVVVGNNNYYVLNRLAAGNYLISLNVGGCETSVEFTAKRCNSILFPNPASDFLYLDLPKDMEFSFELLDINGRKVIPNLITTGPTSVDIRFLASGVYVFLIKNHENELVDSGKIEIIKKP